jgi:adenine-specific DNA methylase
MTMEDIRLEGQAERLGAVNTAVVVDGRKGKEYRLPEAHETKMSNKARKSLADVFAKLSLGMPEEPTPKAGIGASRAFSVDGYGLHKWSDLFTSRQLSALGTFVKWTRVVRDELTKQEYRAECLEAIIAYLACMLDRLSNQSSNLSRWNQGGEKIEGTFARFALPILWDYAECNPLGETSGGYPSAFEWVTLAVDHLANATAQSPEPYVLRQSAIRISSNSIDCIVTDPPYYDAIPYSDLMDYYYVWLRRTLDGLSQDIGEAFGERLSPKWDESENDGELIDDASRHGGDKIKSKTAYEDGMARVFQGCHHALKPEGKLVVVFANKQPDAWETLVSAIIRAGFVVDGSWPIQTERSARTRSLTSAALASSVWLVCKKRPAAVRPGWDNHVLEEMRRNIREKLREFWDAGIRGPDFVWAATGPAMEAYSKHPAVKKANAPGQLMSVSEFLTHVRRMVVDFVVGRVLSGNGISIGADDVDSEGKDRLDEPTAYYLLHRHDFGLDEAPAGACILYAISCGVSDRELASTWDIIGFTKGKSIGDGDDAESAGNGDTQMADEETGSDTEEDSGSKVKLKTWVQRKRRSLGYEAPSGKPIPLIDRVHCLMHIWKGGDLSRVDEYLDANGLRRQELFKRLIQSLIELSSHGSEERSLLESMSNHVHAKGVSLGKAQGSWLPK